MGATRNFQIDIVLQTNYWGVREDGNMSTNGSKQFTVTITSIDGKITYSSTNTGFGFGNAAGGGGGSTSIVSITCTNL